MNGMVLNREPLPKSLKIKLGCNDIFIIDLQNIMF